MLQALATGSATPLLSRFALPAFWSCPPIPALSSHPGSPTLSSSRLPMPTSLFCLLMPALLSGPLVPTLSSPPVPTLLSLSVPALLSPFIPALLSHSVLSLNLTYLIFSALRTFQQALSDEPLRRRLTSLSPVEPLSTFLTLSSLPKKNDCKWFFDTVFLNSRLLADNHTIKGVDLRFGQCGYFVPVQLNRLWQLELLDRKSVYIIKTILLTTVQFWYLLFASYPHHTIKLALKLGLRMKNITIGVVKEKIELTWTNKTIRELDQLFQNNPKWWTEMGIIYSQPRAKAGGKFKKKKKRKKKIF